MKKYQRNLMKETSEKYKISTNHMLLDGIFYTQGKKEAETYINRKCFNGYSSIFR